MNVTMNTNMNTAINTTMNKKKIIKDDDNDNSPKGLFYYENVIDEKEEKELICFLDRDEESNWNPLGETKNSRKVQQYGYIYNYNTGNVKEKTKDIPLQFNFLIDILKQKFDRNFNQVIVNNYIEGQGISSHIDSLKYGDVIACYSIGSDSVIRFTKDKEKYDLFVKRNSLYIMTGDSRFKWKHEMPSRKSDALNGLKLKRGRRISITFRYI